MSGFDADAFDADFFPDGRLKSFMVVNIGHPGAGAFRNRLPRLDAAQVVDFAESRLGCVSVQRSDWSTASGLIRLEPAQT
jgi:hypothetical protein